MLARSEDSLFSVDWDGIIESKGFDGPRISEEETMTTVTITVPEDLSASCSLTKTSWMIAAHRFI